MHKKNNIKLFIILLIAMITLGIGYAGISAINLSINGLGISSVNQGNFNVKFKTAEITSGTGTTSIEDDVTASFNVSNMTKKGDIAVAEYTIKNESNGIGANISIDVSNSNFEFFHVSKEIDDNELQAGDTANVIVKIELIKTPIDEDISTSVVTKLIASPIEDELATGNSSVLVNSSVFVANNYVYELNNKIPSVVSQYNNPNSAMLSFGHPTFLKQELDSDINVISSSVGFQKGGLLYYLKSGNDGLYHSENRELLLDLFGSEGCYDTDSFTICQDSSFYAGSTSNGIAGVFSLDTDFDMDNYDLNNSSWFCVAYNNYYSKCYRQNEGEIFYSSISWNDFIIGEKIPYFGTTYTNYDDAMKVFGYPIFLKHKVDSNNKISESYIGIKHNNQLYYLRGGIDETGLDNVVYRHNVQTVKDLYGQDWSNYCTYYNTYFQCDKEEFSVVISDDGFISFDEYNEENNGFCIISNARSWCYYY